MNIDFFQLIVVLVISALCFRAAYHIGNVLAIGYAEKRFNKVLAQERKKREARYRRLMLDIWADKCTFEFNAKNPDFSELESILNNLHIPKESEL